MSIPFEKFKVTESSWSLYGRFVVNVWPRMATGWPEESKARQKECQKFIEDAIREKLDRERGQ